MVGAGAVQAVDQAVGQVRVQVQEQAVAPLQQLPQQTQCRRLSLAAAGVEAGAATKVRRAAEAWVRAVTVVSAVSKAWSVTTPRQVAAAGVCSAAAAKLLVHLGQRLSPVH